MSVIMTINTACFISWIFLFLLPLYYLFLRWKNKYEVLEGSFKEKNVELYYKLYRPALILPDGKSYIDLFRKYYYKTYGRRNFIVPLTVFGCIAAIGIYALNRTVINIAIKDSGFLILPPIALSAFLGAYLWIGFDQVQRFRTQNFTYHDVHRWGFRFLISIPIAYAFSYAVKEPIGVPVAFFLGAFPLKTLMKYAKRFTDMHLKLGDEGKKETSELLNLQGIERVEAERIQEEGITNILQLAYSDPIDLTMRTTFDFSYVIDIKSQSLLWIYVGNKLNDKLRAIGLRSSHEANVLKQMLESDKEDIIEIANKNILDISIHIGVSEESFRKTLHEISDDPHALFLYEIW